MSGILKKRLILILAMAVIICLGSIVFISRALAQAETVYTVKEDYVYLLDYYRIAGYNSQCTVTDPNGKTITVAEDGNFIVITPGDYKIINNKSSVQINLHCVIDKEQATVKLKEEFAESYTIAQNMRIPYATIQTQYSSYNFSSFSIEYKGNTLIKDAKMNGDFYEYRPLRAGEYTVKYNYTNIFGEKTSAETKFVVADTPVFIYDSYNRNVNLGYRIKVSDISFLYGGEIYTPELSVVFGGTEEIVHAEYVFNSEGIYTINAKCVVNGQTFSYTNTIDARFMYSNYFVGSYFYAEENIDAPSYSIAVNGVSIMPTAAASSIYYCEKINLNDFSKGDSLIEFQTLENNGYLGKIRIELIDAYDPLNKISVYWWQTPGWNNLCYMLAEYGTVSKGISNEAWLFGEARETYGALINGFSLDGSGQSGKGLFNFSFDNENAVVYTNGAVGFPGEDYTLLNMYSSVDMGNGREFKGFTTGEVFLKINFCNQVKGGILVTEVAGRNLSGRMQVTPTNQTCFDVMVEGNSLSNGIVGYDYKLPEVISDNIALGEIDVSFDITKGGKSYLSAVSNGYFKPTEAGTYVLKYSAVDNFMQTCVKEYQLVIAQNPNEIYCVEQNASQPRIMNKYKFDYSVTGGFGNLKQEIVYKLNDKILPIDELGYVFINENGSLTVSVSVSDHNNYSKTFTFNKAIDSDNVVFDYKNSQFPSVMRGGQSLKLPEITYVDYKTGVSGKAVCYVDNQKITNYTIKIPENVDNLVVKYVANEGTAREDVLEKNIRVESKTATVIDMLSFDRNVFATSVISSGIVFETNNAKYDGSSITMPYAMSARDMFVAFSLNENMKQFKEVELFYEDYNNPENVIKVTLYYDNEGAKIRINNDSKGYIIVPALGTYTGNQGALNGIKYEKFTLIYDCWRNVFLSNVGNEIVKVTKNLRGETFKGFEDNLVKFSLRFTNVSGKCGITLNEMNKQIFSDYIIENYKNSDNAGPSLCLKTNLLEKSDYQVGSQVIIPLAKGCDVLQFNTNVSLKIIQGSKVIYQAQDPTDDYVLTLSEKGNYTVIYTLADSLGNSKKYQFVLNSCDKTNPVISVDSVPTNVKVGDTISIPKYNVQDQSEVEVIITLIEPTGVCTKVNDKVKLQYTGKYYISYFAIDAEGNSTNYRVEINVEA